MLLVLTSGHFDHNVLRQNKPQLAPPSKFKKFQNLSSQYELNTQSRAILKLVVSIENDLNVLL